MKYLSRKQISVILTIIALVLWSFSITQVKFEIGKYGIIGGFPVLFFIALGILTAASCVLWTDKERHGKLLLTQLVFLIVSLWLIPVLMGSTDYVIQDIFRYLAESGGFIVSNGHLEAGIWYHDWPSYGIFTASASMLAGITIPPIAVYLSAFVIQIVLLPMWHYILRAIIPDDHPNYVWAGLWIFYVGSWTGESRLAPQYLGICLALVLLVFIVRYYTVNRTEVLSDANRSEDLLAKRLLIILLCATLIITHGVTAFAALIAIVLLTIMRKIPTWNLAAIFTALLFSWALYVGTTAVSARLPVFMQQFLDIGTIFQSSVGARISGNADHTTVNLIKIVLSSIFFIMAVLGLVFSWKDRKKDPLFTTVLAITGSFFLLLPVFVYSGQLLIRVFLMVLIPLSYFTVKLLRSRAATIIVPILLVVCIPLNLIGHYGNQRIDYISDREFSGAQFADRYTQDFYLTGNIVYTSTEYPAFISQTSRVEDKAYEDVVFLNNGQIVMDRLFKKAWPYIIVIDQRARDLYDYSFNKPNLIPEIENSLRVATNCNLVFSNPEMNLYVNDP
jgi:hypothetical protein